MKIIIFSDMDGTILDKNYSFEKAKRALNKIKKLKIPLIFVSSKTKKEIEYYRNKITNKHPFIAENGGGIFIPLGYFGEVELKEKDKKYFIMRLGEKYDILREALKEAKDKGFNIKGFGDMNIKEIMDITGLSKLQAKWAKERYFDEPFLFNGTRKEEKKLIDFFKKKNLYITKGKYYHLLGKNDKGKAVKILSYFYEKKYGKIFSIGIGDGKNDFPMLKAVDLPVLLKRENGKYEKIKIKNLTRSKKIGPEGFNEEILKILENF